MNFEFLIINESEDLTNLDALLKSISDQNIADRNSVSISIANTSSKKLNLSLYNINSRYIKTTKKDSPLKSLIENIQGDYVMFLNQEFKLNSPEALNFIFKIIESEKDKLQIYPIEFRSVTKNNNILAKDFSIYGTIFSKKFWEGKKLNCLINESPSVDNIVLYLNVLYHTNQISIMIKDNIIFEIIKQNNFSDRLYLLAKGFLCFIDYIKTKKINHLAIDFYQSCITYLLVYIVNYSVKYHSITSDCLLDIYQEILNKYSYNVINLNKELKCQSFEWITNNLDINFTNSLLDLLDNWLVYEILRIKDAKL